jgi:hypothetical protein
LGFQSSYALRNLQLEKNRPGAERCYGAIDELPCDRAYSFVPWELVVARAVMERCREFADPACRSVSVGMNEDPYVATLGNLAVTLALLGYLDQARLQLSEELSEARRLGHALTLAVVLAFANWHDWLTSSPELKGHAEQLLAVSNEHG